MFQVHSLSPARVGGRSTRPAQLQKLRCNKTVIIRRAPLQVQAKQSASASSKPAKDPAELRSDMIKGCKTVMMELQGLDFPRTDVRGYFQFVVKAPAGVAKDFDLSRSRVVVEQLMAGQEAEITDVEGLKAAQLILSDVWRWRRRGGGMDDETDRPTYAIALESLQNIEPEQIDRITSSLLDNLPISEVEKRQMSGSVQQVAMAGINGAVWGSLAACLAALLIFNFARGG